jgi:hypothetical protein
MRAIPIVTFLIALFPFAAADAAAHRPRSAKRVAIYG